MHARAYSWLCTSNCEECNVSFVMRIADASFDEEGFRVYCDAHIPETDVVVFTSTGCVSIPIDTPANRALLEELEQIAGELLAAAYRVARSKEDLERFKALAAREEEMLTRLEVQAVPADELDRLLPNAYSPERVIELGRRVQTDLTWFPRGYRIGLRFTRPPSADYLVTNAVVPHTVFDYEVCVKGNPVVTDEQG